MMKRDLNIGAVLAMTLVLLLSVNLIGAIAFRHVKLDLTEDSLFTLSKGSKAMLSKLDEKVTLKLFYSKRSAGAAPVIKAYAERTIQLLQEFASHSKGLVVVEVIDPRPDTEEEEWAIKYGIRPIQGDSEPIYFGLAAINETGTERSVPFLDPNREGFLEYDIASIIVALSHSDRKTIGVLSPLNIMGGNDPMARIQGLPQADPWALISELKQSYNVKEVETTASEIDSKIDLLLVVHPKKISEQTEYAIDQYIMKGGKAVILVDGQCEYDARNQRNPSPQARFQESFESNLPKLLPALGIEVAPGKVLTDINCAAKVNVGGGLPQDYIAYLMFKKDNCNQAELMSANLESLLIGVPGVLKKKADAKYTITPLIESSDQAMEMDGFRIKMMTMTPNPDLEALKRDYTPGNQKLGFAYKITGKFETAFPGGKPESLLPKEPNQKKDEEKEKKGDEAKAVHLAAAEKEGTVVVIGDVDFITDDFAVDVRNFFGQKMITARGDNLNFINNVIEIMTGSEDLINLRTRGKSVRPFTTVEAIERRAQEKFKGEEDQLQKKLDETNQKISELQRGKNDPGQHAILSPEQVKELDEFRKEVAETKKHLRGVRLNLRKDIESLGARLKFMNIALMPILITLFSFVPSAWRTHRMRTNRRD